MGIIQHVSAAVGFFEFIGEFFPSGVVKVSLSIIASLVGPGGTTESTHIVNVETVIEAVLWIPITLMVVLVCWNIIYGLEEEFRADSDMGYLFSQRQTEEIKSATYTFFSESANVCGRTAQEFFWNIMKMSIIAIGSLILFHLTN